MSLLFCMIEVRRGCSVRRRTSQLETRWYQHISRILLRHHWSRTSIFLTAFDRAQHSDPYSIIGKMYIGKLYKITADTSYTIWLTAYTYYNFVFILTYFCWNAVFELTKPMFSSASASSRSFSIFSETMFYNKHSKMMYVAIPHHNTYNAATAVI